MTPELYHKITSDPKLHDYLRNHSYWYKDLNRDPNNYKDFYASYKQFKTSQRLNKVNETVDALDTVNSILKILK